MMLYQKNGLFLAIMIVGIITTLCAAAVTVMGGVGIGAGKRRRPKLIK